jgi:hypothetical protein
MMIRTLTLAGLAILLSSGAFAQALSDVDYCYELSSLYRMYARGGQVDVNAANSMSDCDKGKAAGAIASLTKILQANQVKIPPQK